MSGETWISSSLRGSLPSRHAVDATTATSRYLASCIRRLRRMTERLGESVELSEAVSSHRSTASNLRFAIWIGTIVAATHSAAAAPNPNNISAGDVCVPYSRADR